MEYIDTKYIPDKNDTISLIYLESRGDLKKALNQLAAESSVGTWTEVTTKTEYSERIRARVFEIYRINQNSAIVKVAYPRKLFDEKNLAQITSLLMGNLFELKWINKIRIMDIRFPPWFSKGFEDPLTGIDGIRKFFDAKGRPILLTVIKPKLGLRAEEISKIFYQASLGGVDLVKDEEILTGQSYAPFKERLEKVMESLSKAEEKTGEKKGYLVNITDSFSNALEKIEIVKESGNRFVMINLVAVGWNDIVDIVKYAHKKKIWVFGHLTIHGAFVKNISYYILEKMARFIGFDLIHIKGFLGKVKVSLPKSMRQYEVSTKRELDEMLSCESLSQSFYQEKTTLPIVWGGTHPGMAEAFIRMFGEEFAIQSGGGIHGHPKGTYHGAKAWRVALEEISKGKSILESEDEDLKMAIEKWGYIDPKLVEEKWKRFLENLSVFEEMVKSEGLSAIEMIDRMFWISERE